jgi:DNA-binding MarR family transcriptional regulator
VATQTGSDDTAETAPAPPKRTEVAFLLTQLGTFAAERFGERVAALDLTRPQAGLLRLVGRVPGQSQQAVAEQLGMPPSRLVALVDGLEDQSLVERRRSAVDRRHHALHLTDAGQQTLARLSGVAAEHEAAITAPLTDAERAALQALLGKLAAAHQLTPGVHPGYRHVDPRPRRR